MICIYVLRCPRTGDVRYVGKTSFELHARLKAHLSEAKYKRLRSHRHDWLRSLIREGLAPTIELDVVVPDTISWEMVERERIEFHRSFGADLVNGTDGGIGLVNPSKQVRIRMSKAERTFSEEGLASQIENAKRVGSMNKGRKKSAEERALMKERYTGRKLSEETLAKMRLAQSGRKVRQPHTAEARAKMSATRKGRKLSSEHRAAISAGLCRHSDGKG